MPHIHEKVDFTVEVFVVYKDRVLLRKHDKYKIWLSIGGHIELDEDPNQAAVREVKEEVGLDIILADDLLMQTENTDTYTELIPPKFLNRHRINPGHEHVCSVYFAKAINDKLILEKPDDECAWLSKEELEKLDIRPSIRLQALQALHELAE
jgi:8-oxo-dGTP pyrophosphatase MutT (NUDIX family)